MKEDTDSTIILNSIPFPIAWFDCHFNFLGANSKLVDSLTFLLIDKDERTHHKCLSLFFKTAFLENDVSDKTVSFMHLTENVSLKISIQKNNSHHLAAYIMSVENVSELTQLKIELNTLKEKTLKSAQMAILGEMSSGLAHEIKNPLTVIISHTQKIRELTHLDFNNNTEEIIRRLDKIENTSIRIDKIVKGLKMFARDGTNDPFQSTIVSTLINESLELCSEKLKNHDINIFVDNVDPNLVINCRPVQISQILLNLIGNSKDAIENLEERWIRIQVKDIGDKIRFSLTDSGKGIPKEVAKKITDAFFTTKSVGHGTGLGLSISKSIIESHHGSLFIDEDCPHTKFIFDIPKGLDVLSA